VSARGCPGDRTIMYPRMCRVRPPRQLLFDVPFSVRQAAQVFDCLCFRAPQAQRLWDLHDGQRKCPLDGWNVRPHSVQTRLVITS
jgi:hypothetical protein